MTDPEPYNTNDSLQISLSAFYTSYVLKGKSKSEAATVMKAILLENPSLTEMARNKLIEFNKLDAVCGGQLAKRCYVSHINKIALEEALS